MTNIYYVGLSVIEIIVGCSNDWLDFNNVIQIECLLLKIKKKHNFGQNASIAKKKAENVLGCNNVQKNNNPKTKHKQKNKKKFQSGDLKTCSHFKKQGFLGWGLCCNQSSCLFTLIFLIHNLVIIGDLINLIFINTLNWSFRFHIHKNKLKEITVVFWPFCCKSCTEIVQTPHFCLHRMVR